MKYKLKESQSNVSVTNGVALVCDHYVMSCSKVMVEQEQLAAEKQRERRFRFFWDVMPCWLASDSKHGITFQKP